MAYGTTDRKRHEPAFIHGAQQGIDSDILRFRGPASFLRSLRKESRYRSRALAQHPAAVTDFRTQAMPRGSSARAFPPRCAFHPAPTMMSASGCGSGPWSASVALVESTEEAAAARITHFAANLIDRAITGRQQEGRVAHTQLAMSRHRRAAEYSREPGHENRTTEASHSRKALYCVSDCGLCRHFGESKRDLGIADHRNTFHPQVARAE